MLSYHLITTDQQLAQCCAATQQASTIALDTEFVRIRTYHPGLGLIQLFDGHTVSLIDPLTINQWQPFIDLLTASHIMKYLHAGGEDLEVFLNRFQVVPQPMLDTQIMAAFLGYPSSWGFAAMVAEFTDMQLDKSESRTDWLARPLTEKQCQYAAADVVYLLPIAQQLHQQAIDQNKLAFIDSECQLQVQRRRQVIDPQNAYQDFSQAWQLRPRQLAVLQILAAWRLEHARQKDIAVNFVVKEEALWKVARYMPSSLAELRALGVSGSEIRYHGEVLLDAVKAVKPLTDEQLPPAVANLVDMPNYRQVFNDLKTAVKQVSQESGYSPEMLASRRQINQLLNWHWQLKPKATQPELLSGWRGELLQSVIGPLLEQY